MREVYTVMRRAFLQGQRREVERRGEPGKGPLFINNGLMRGWPRFSKRSNRGVGCVLLLSELMQEQFTDEQWERDADGWFPVPVDSRYADRIGASCAQMTNYLNRLEEMGLIKLKVSGFPARRVVQLQYPHIMALIVKCDKDADKVDERYGMKRENAAVC